MTIGAYRFTHVLSGVFYIGSSRDIEHRMREHRSDFKTGRHPFSLLKIVYRDGDEIRLEMFPTIDRDTALAKERELISAMYEDPKCANTHSYFWLGKALSTTIKNDERILAIEKDSAFATAANRPPSVYRVRQLLSAIYPDKPACYVIQCKDGHFYIGSSISLVKRVRNHRMTLEEERHKNKRLQKSFTKWEDLIITYKVHSTLKEARIHEQALLDERYSDPLCCNVGTGAEVLWARGIPPEIVEKIASKNRGRKFGPEFREMRRVKMTGIPRTDEQKRKLSVSLRGRKRDPEVSMKVKATRAANLDKNPSYYKVSEETRRRISAANLRRGWNQSSIDAMRAANKRRDVTVVIEGVRYETITEASRILGISAGTIKQRCLSRSSRFTQWFFEDKKRREAVGETVYKQGWHQLKPVEIDGVKFPSIKDAAAALGMAFTTVSGRVRSPNFPTWKYAVREQP